MYKVTVIIPTYKRSKYILRAIESVLNQEEVECEIIVVDDNGIGTEEQKNVELKLKKYIECNNIKYIKHEKNLNGSEARNTGIKLSTGEFIAFLDDDDWYEPKKLITQIRLIEKEKTDACLCGFSRVYENINEATVIPNLNFKKQNLKIKLLSFSIDTCAGSCLLIRKNIIDKVGLFDSSFIRHQDLEFLYRLSKYTSVSVVNKKMVNIYMHLENVSIKSGYDVEKYRIHFLETFQSDINSLDKEEINFIKDIHYIEISKAYIKNKQIITALKKLKKTSNFFNSIKKIIKDIIIFSIKKRKANIN